MLLAASFTFREPTCFSIALGHISTYAMPILPPVVILLKKVEKHHKKRGKMALAQTGLDEYS